MTPAERLSELEAGRNPRLVAKLSSGYVELAPNQFLPGYCLLLASPLVGQLNDLEEEPRTKFLLDMARVGDAIRTVTGCRRINYSIYGNLDPFLHAHIIPRFEWEDESFAAKPPMQIPDEIKAGHEFSSDTHQEMLEKLQRELSNLHG